jgi:polyisoprenyl-phosphate glycosyltransferase
MSTAAPTDTPEPRPRLSVVAPCFDEAEGLGEFCRQLGEACEASVGKSYEIVLINDGSRDETWSVMRHLAANLPQVVAINLSRNYGHQIALTAGLHAARGERILIIDADLQDPPELLGEMMAIMDAQGADVVYGQRRKRDGETLFKSMTAALFYRLLRRLVDIDIPLDTGDFRLMSRRALDVLNSMGEQFRFIRGMVSWMGLRQIPLLYDRNPRFAGTTGYSLGKMIRFAFDAITGFSIMPLRLASYLGVAMGFASVAMIGYTILSWALHSAVAGWTSLTTIVLVIGSTQLLVLGVFGEYLGRMYIETKHRPLYVIENAVGQALPDSRSEPGTWQRRAS